MRAHIRIESSDDAEAKALSAALAPDDGHGVSSHQDGPAIVIESESKTIMGLLRGIDDALACLRAAGIR